MGHSIRRALISVSDKDGIVEFCHELVALGIELISSGGTAALLSGQGLKVIEVADHTGFPEMMGGRLKTLHPKVHGGILGRRGQDEAVMLEHGIAPIDLVVVNLYPFRETVAKPGCTLADAIENIDIGGPAMIRSAAKNHASVAVVVDPADYAGVLAELRETDVALAEKTRFHLARKAFAHTAGYDAAIAAYLAGNDADAVLDESLVLSFRRAQSLRYGENPHQQAAFYVEIGARSGIVATAEQIQGKELSFNNIADADAALECVKGFAAKPACVIVKHANPCGVAQADTLFAAYERAYSTDPVSAFGGIIAFNRELSAEAARLIIDRQFVEVVIAPEISEDAREVLATKPNVRVLRAGAAAPQSTPAWDYRRVTGGLLVQEADQARLTREKLTTVSRRAPTEDEIRDLLFAWNVVKFVKSNAIVYARDGQTIGIGAGQMSRVYSARIAALKAAEAGLAVAGSVVASDAFFPFRDGVDSAAEAGVTAVIQPGGSVRDAEVIAAADGHGLAMVFTGMRHFRH